MLELTMTDNKKIVREALEFYANKYYSKRVDRERAKQALTVLDNLTDKAEFIEQLEGMKKDEVEEFEGGQVILFTLKEHNAAIDAVIKLVKGEEGDGE